MHVWDMSHTDERVSILGAGGHSEIAPEVWIRNGEVKIQHMFKMAFGQMNKNSLCTVEENEQKTSMSNVQIRNRNCQRDHFKSLHSLAIKEIKN